MNLLDMLAKELAHKDWTQEEKARYLYIRCCELFTYDPRYILCNKIPNGEILKEEILNKKINLENVTDNWIVCKSHTKEIYIKVLQNLLNIKAEKKLSKNSIHVWSEFFDGKQNMKADATIKKCPDLTRAKMKLETQEYHPKIEELNYTQHLKEMDKKIGYIKEEYQNKHIEELKQKLDSVKNKITDPSELLLFKWKVILMELKKYESINLPINQHTSMRYLMLHLLTLEELKKVKTTELFQVSRENDWCFVNIYSLLLQDKTLYYMHPRHLNDFKLYEIKKEQMEYYENRLRLVN